MKKRGLAAFLTVAILLTVCIPLAISAYASNKPITPNMDAVDAILYGDRRWVYETLIEDSRANNPMTILSGNPAKKSMAREALDDFRNIDSNGESHDSAYAKLVWVMDKVYNADEYAEGLVDEAGNLVSWVVGLFTDADDLQKTIDDLTTSTQEMRYDRLMKSVFTEKFVGSGGETLEDTEASLVYIRKAKNALEYFNEFTKFANSGIKSVIGSENLPGFEAEYINEYAIPYGDALESFLSTISEQSTEDAQKSAQLMIETASCLAAIGNFETVKPAKDYEGFSYVDYLADDLVENGVKSVMSGAGMVLEIGETALDSYLYVNSIQQQKEAVTGPIQRMASLTSDQDLKSALDYFAQMMSDEYDTSILSYDSIVTYLRQNATVNKLVADGSKAAIKKLLHINAESLSGVVIAKATAVAGISSYVADKAVGLKQTCEKTYELLRWEDLTDLCVLQCKHDLAAYITSPSEETAEKALDDLMLLQRVRLYGEKIAHGLIAGQMTSWVGQLYGGGMLLEDWEATYQQSVDELLATTVVPSYVGLTVDAGETLIVSYRNDIGFYGFIQKGGRTISNITELASRLAGGITVNGTFSVANTSGQPMGLGYVDGKGGSSVTLSGSPFLIGELRLGSGSTLWLQNDTDLEVRENLLLTNCTCTADSGQVITTQTLEVTGTASGFAVNALGNVNGSSGSLAALTFSGDSQTCSGTLSTGSLRMDADVVELVGPLTVTDTLYQPEAEIINPRNLVFSGNTIEENFWEYPITLKSASIQNVTFHKDVTDQGGTTYTGKPTIKGLFQQVGNSTVSDGAELTLRGTYSLSNKTMEGDGDIHLYGDILSANGIIHPNLILLGRLPQTITGALTVDNLNLDNIKTVTLENTVTVTESVTNSTCDIKGSYPLRLSETAQLVGGTYYGDLIVSTWNTPKVAKILGTLTVDSMSTITCPDLTINGDLIAKGPLTLFCNKANISGSFSSSASLTLPLDDSTMSIGKELSSKGSLLLSCQRAEIRCPLSIAGPLTLSSGELTVFGLASNGLILENDASMSILGAANISGTLSSSSHPIQFADLAANSLTASGDVRVAGDLAVSGTTSFVKLTLNGKLPQSITGADFSVVDLYLHNNTTKGISLAQNILVSGEYENTGKEVSGIGIPTNSTYTTDQHFQRDLALASDLTLSGCTMELDGDLTVTNGVVKLENAHLIVNGMMQLSGGIQVDESSTVTVKYLTILSGTSQINGGFTARSDLFLRGPLTGTGQVTIYGDLDSSSTLEIGSLTFPGKLLQQAKGTTIKAGDVTFANTSRNGITLLSTIQYTGEATGTDCIQSGIDYLQKEA